MYTITLSDGTKLEGLKLNGNNFISGKQISEGVFRGKLTRVKIECEDEDKQAGGMSGEFLNMELLQLKEYGGEWWFILREMPAEKYELLKLSGNVDYVAMMLGVEL